MLMITFADMFRTGPQTGLELWKWVVQGESAVGAVLSGYLDHMDLAGLLIFRGLVWII
jgi:hypothetical protein